MAAFKEFRQLPSFEKGLKKLERKFRTLREDLQSFENSQLKLTHLLGIDNHGVVQITGLSFQDPKIFKAVKFACKSLKGRGSKSGIRIIYAYHEKDKVIEYIEIYFKADQENEDRALIERSYPRKT